MEIDMFSRNEKYGQALHLQYGASNGEADGSSLNGHFKASSFWQRVLGFGQSQTSESTVEVDLLNAVSRQAAKRDYKILNKSVNENEIERLSVNNAFVK
ncbi:hypothetical protein NBZ79_14550 [Sneathiella marina]|uniref:Uncharacterized protein n=1 Tax=Sneathiella marina TaxID=2950108 RepID=A0ABY4W0K8_9PROT|nr:hypothetical protein [Sneathiella marina]USG60389.1 hypothetical protein NBZ79_14550 [Sneathiella marina]